MSGKTAANTKQPLSVCFCTPPSSACFCTPPSSALLLHFAIVCTASPLRNRLHYSVRPGRLGMSCSSLQSCLLKSSSHACSSLPVVPAQVFPSCLLKSHRRACSSLTVVPAQVSPSCLLKSSHHACSSLPLGMVWSSAYNSHRRHSHASSPHLRPLLTVPKLHSLLACSLMVWSPVLTKPSNLNATRRWRSCCPRPRSRRQRTTPARRCATGAKHRSVTWGKRSGRSTEGQETCYFLRDKQRGKRNISLPLLGQRTTRGGRRKEFCC